ncbi:MAG: peptidylprolyl isomerase [Armatimonadota bacterium]
MSIVRIRKKMGAGMKYLLGGILVIFGVGIFISFGGRGGGGGGAPQGFQTTGPSVMATVNGKAITRQVFMTRLMNMQGRFASQQLAADRHNKLRLLEQFITDVLMTEAIRRERIKVSREEIEQGMEQRVQARLAQLFPSETGGYSKRRLKAFLEKQGIAYDDYLERLRAEQEDSRDYVIGELEHQKLREKIQGSVQVTEEDLKESFKQVEARHLLIAPEAATPELSEQAQRAAAKQRAEKLLAQLKAGADFAKLAQEHSDDEESAKKGGKLKALKRDDVFVELMGWFPEAGALIQQSQGYTRLRRDARKISDALFARAKGELTPVIETVAGFHIFKVEGIKTELPEDFEDNKKQLLDNYRRSRGFEAWADYEAALRESAEVVIEDAELAAYQAMEAGDYEAAYALLQEALGYTRRGEYVGDPFVNYQLGQVAEKLGKPEAALAHYADAEQAAAGSPDLHLAMGKLYRQRKQKAQALAQFQQVHEAAETLAPENRFVHQELKSIYEEMGEKELAAAQQAWLDELDKEMEAAYGPPPAA